MLQLLKEVLKEVLLVMGELELSKLGWVCAKHTFHPQQGFLFVCLFFIPALQFPSFKCAHSQVLSVHAHILMRI